MRIYGQEQQLEQVICNQCKKELKIKNGIVQEGCFSVQYPFGYFSGKDGEVHCFDLCEECYDKMLAKFRIPAQIKENTELL